MPTGVVSTMPVSTNPLPQINQTSPSTIPTFEDLLKRFNAPLDISKTATGLTPLNQVGLDEFNQATSTLQPTGGIRPETQRILDLIKQRSDEASKVAGDRAVALAGRRGLAGSSIEGFNQAQAVGEVQKSTRDAEAQILLQNLQNDQRLRELLGGAQLERSGQLLQGQQNQDLTLAELESNRRLNEANLTSDEIASLRNKQFAENQLALEALLGTQGLDIARSNVNLSGDIARREQRNQLLTSGIGALLPSITQGLFGGGSGSGGGGAGLFSRLFGGGGGGTANVPALGGNIPVAPAGGNLFGTLLGVGAGGAAALGVNNALNSLGQGAKAVLAPLFNPVDTVKKVGKTVSKIFPFRDNLVFT